ncbi:hypothetical protein [Lacinutrix neustonica]|uniref:hypothetical protein n=1 Tax=Lacinutrix neustonica TaxID=2980107 RepID=UPI0036F44BE6
MTHKRTFNIKKDFSEICCEDEVYCNSKHQIVRSLHFIDNAEIKLKDNKAIITVSNRKYHIVFENFARLKVGSYFLSRNYGHKIEAKKLLAFCDIEKNTVLNFKIQSVHY